MAFDGHKNFAVSTVATAPSPATTGTSLVVASGEGSRFPTPPYNAVVAPASATPTPANSEVIRCTVQSTDTLSTIARQQEGSTARSIQVGDRIYAGSTAKTFTDIETVLSSYTGTPIPLAERLAAPVSTAVPAANTWYAVTIVVLAATALNGVEFKNGATVAGNGRACLFDSSGTTKLVDRTTNVALSGANARQRVPFDNSYTTAPGTYIAVLSLFNASATAFMAPILSAYGATGTQATTTPSSVTVADMSTTPVPMMNAYII